MNLTNRIYNPAAVRSAALLLFAVTISAALSAFAEQSVQSPDGARTSAPAAPVSLVSGPSDTASGQTGQSQQGENKEKGQTAESAGEKPAGRLPEEKAPKKPSSLEKIGRFADVFHEKLSERVTSTAAWLDSFFGDQRILSEENHTQLRFRYDVFREEASSLFVKPYLDLRLVLPQLEKKTHIIFSDYPREAPPTPSAPGVVPPQYPQPPGQRNFTTSLRYIIAETIRSHTSVRAGLLFHKMAPGFFIGPRYRYLVPVAPWSLRFTEEFLWYTDTGWQSNTGIDFERPLPHDLFFRTSVGGTWFERQHGYFYGVSFLLREPLGRLKALEYEWDNSFQTRPEGELMETDLRVRYRQSIWRDWFFFELTPQCRFPRDRNFKSTPGILFRFEMVFGKYL